MDSEFTTDISNYNLKEDGEVVAESYSNIALIKYWGKYEKQIPANPSLSFTLSEAKTQTRLKFSPKKSEKSEIKVFLENQIKPSFVPKIEKFFSSIQDYIPFISQYDYEIYTQNSFPHSSGIASSASGMSALAKCLIAMEKEFCYEMEESLKKASFLARIGSGSASRSVYPGTVVWGKSKDVEGSSNEFSIPINDEVHPVFADFRDTILIIHRGEKKVSSTVGHQLMQNHPYAEKRFQEAHINLRNLLKVMKEGDVDGFIKITEHEALTLHAMMMMSNPYFILMEPNTLSAIKRIWKFREEKRIPVCFTLDAGANVHVLYPKEFMKEVEDFIQRELKSLCENGEVLYDCVNQFL